MGEISTADRQRPRKQHAETLAVRQDQRRLVPGTEPLGPGDGTGVEVATGIASGNRGSALGPIPGPVCHLQVRRPLVFAPTHHESTGGVSGGDECRREGRRHGRARGVRQPDGLRNSRAAFLGVGHLKLPSVACDSQPQVASCLRPIGHHLERIDAQRRVALEMSHEHATVGRAAHRREHRSVRRILRPQRRGEPDAQRVRVERHLRVDELTLPRRRLLGRSARGDTQ